MLLGSDDFATAEDQARLNPQAFTPSAQIDLIAMKPMPDSQARKLPPSSISIRVLWRHILTLLIASKEPLRGK